MGLQCVPNMLTVLGVNVVRLQLVWCSERTLLKIVKSRGLMSRDKKLIDK